MKANLLRGESVRLTALNTDDLPVIARWQAETLRISTNDCPLYWAYYGFALYAGFRFSMVK